MTASHLTNWHNHGNCIRWENRTSMDRPIQHGWQLKRHYPPVANQSITYSHLLWPRQLSRILMFLGLFSSPLNSTCGDLFPPSTSMTVRVGLCSHVQTSLLCGMSTQAHPNTISERFVAHQCCWISTVLRNYWSSPNPLITNSEQSRCSKTWPYIKNSPEIDCPQLTIWKGLGGSVAVRLRRQLVLICQGGQTS